MLLVLLSSLLFIHWNFLGLPGLHRLRPVTCSSPINSRVTWQLEPCHNDVSNFSDGTWYLSQSAHHQSMYSAQIGGGSRLGAVASASSSGRPSPSSSGAIHPHGSHRVAPYPTSSGHKSPSAVNGKSSIANRILCVDLNLLRWWCWWDERSGEVRRGWEREGEENSGSIRAIDTGRIICSFKMKLMYKRVGHERRFDLVRHLSLELLNPNNSGPRGGHR